MIVTLILQQLLDSLHCLLPAHVLLDGQALEGLDRSFGRVLRLQVALKAVDVVIEPFEVLLLDRGDTFHNFRRRRSQTRGR